MYWTYLVTLNRGHNCYWTWSEHDTRMKGCVFHWHFWLITFKQSEQKTEKIPSRNVFPNAKACSFPEKKTTKFNFPLTQSKSCKAVTFHIYSREKSRQNKMQNKNKAISKINMLLKSFQLPHWKYRNTNILSNEGKWYLEI